MGLHTAITAFIVTLIVSGTAFAAGGGGGDAWSGPDWSGKSKEFQAGYKAIENADFKEAVAQFTKVVAATPNDADAMNYLGYSHRKTGDYESAVKLYSQALALNPKHKGAHEYLGEAYLEMNNLAKAKEHLAKLDDICWLGCDEYRELKAAVKAYETKAKS